MEHGTSSDTNCNCCAWNDPQRLGKGAGKVENQRTTRDHPNYSIVKIGQNTEKNSVDLRRLAITQTPVKGQQLMLVLKTRKEKHNKIIRCAWNIRLSDVIPRIFGDTSDISMRTLITCQSIYLIYFLKLLKSIFQHCSLKIHQVWVQLCSCNWCKHSSFYYTW